MYESAAKKRAARNSKSTKGTRSSPNHPIYGTPRALLMHHHHPGPSKKPAIQPPQGETQ